MIIRKRNWHAIRRKSRIAPATAIKEPIAGNVTPKAAPDDGCNRRIIKQLYNAGTLDKARHRYHTTQSQTIEERVDSSADAEIQFTALRSRVYFIYLQSLPSRLPDFPTPPPLLVGIEIPLEATQPRPYRGEREEG